MKGHDLDDVWQLEEYAINHFKAQKKGAFGSKIPVKELLQWQKGALKRGLLEQTTKLAPNIFKCVYQFLYRLRFTKLKSQ
jgi:hypothetical protein